MSDYKHQYYFPAEKEGYAGVALISKVEPLKVDNGFGIDEAKEHDAGKWLLIKSKFYYQNFIITNFKNHSANNFDKNCSDWLKNWDKLDFDD